MLSGFPVTPQCDCGLHSPCHRGGMLINSWLLSLQHLHFIRVQCKWLFCELVHSAFCMLSCVRSCQGAEEYMGPQSPGSSGHLWPRKFSILEAVFSCIGLVITAPLPGQSFPSGYSVCPLACLSTGGLAVNPSAEQGSWKHLWQHQRTKYL